MALTKNQEITEYIIDTISDYKGTLCCELHNELFNTDYYIIGTYPAKEWLNKYGVFEAIEEIKNYEQDNFGEVNTDLSNPEKVVNMLVYILGENILSESETLRDNWDDALDNEMISNIKEELKIN